jgi:hypothetical protein
VDDWKPAIQDIYKGEKVLKLLLMRGFLSTRENKE